MNNIKNNVLFFSLVFMLLFVADFTRAVEIFSRDSEHKGVVEFEPYHIYPENRVGNAIYLEKKTFGFSPSESNY